MLTKKIGQKLGRGRSAGVLVIGVLALVVGFVPAASAQPSDTAGSCTLDQANLGLCLPFAGGGADPELRAVQNAVINGYGVAAERYVSVNAARRSIERNAQLAATLATPIEDLRAAYALPAPDMAQRAGPGGRSGSAVSKVAWELREDEPVGTCDSDGNCTTHYYFRVEYDLDLDHINPWTLRL